MEAFFVEVEDLRCAVGLLACVEFADIADVEFGDICGAACAGEVVRAEAECGVEGIDGFVHQHRVVGHVEVAIVVDPFGFHDQGF